MGRALLKIAITMMLCASLFSQAQQNVVNSNTVVPSFVKFSATLTDVNAKPLSGTVGVTFLLYKDEQGGAPLWMETQNITPDKTGHYTVVLGSTTNQGLPTDLFASGEARWLAVQAEGQAEQPRVLLLSVPYALKAGDAQTLGGMPASAFMPAAPGASKAAAASSIVSAAPSSAAAPPPASSNVTTTGGTAGSTHTFVFVQDATGGRTVAGAPAAMLGFFTIGSTLSKRSAQSFAYDGTSLIATTPGVINE